MEQVRWRVTIEEVLDVDDDQVDIASVSDHDATSVCAFLIEQISLALPESPTMPVPSHAEGSSPVSEPHERNESGPSPEYIARMIECAKQPGFRRQAPAMADALAALKDMRAKLRGESRGKSGGYKALSIDAFTRHRMDGMCSLLSLYTDEWSLTYNKWGASSLQAAVTFQRGRFCSRRLRELCRAYIEDRLMLPFNPYGDWNESMLTDEDLVNDICLHLQELGKDITAGKLATYLARPDVMEKHGITRPISERTAIRWLQTLGYRFGYAKRGQYADGHERADVVWYWQNKFLPWWMELEARMEKWCKDNLPEYGPRPDGKPVLVHFHDEMIFYANNCRRKFWCHKNASAKPYAKGDGPSLMVADYVSAKFGWLLSRDGKWSARRVMKLGKNRDGYFDADDIMEQAEAAMAILEEDYPEYEHILVYDNATIHLKQPDGSLSALKMPLKPSKNFMVDISQRGADGKLVYDSLGKVLKTKIRMHGVEFHDGRPQDLYYPKGHPSAGVFKGMKVILEERGITVPPRDQPGYLRAQCPDFICKGIREPPFNCCCRCLLFNEPDFVNIDSLLEITCKARGFVVLFLPKFHCELNFIEQCWGYAKRVYRRLNPESSREDALERNALEALNSIPLESMRRCVLNFFYLSLSCS